MKIFGKALATILLFVVLTVSSYGAYDTVSCDTNAAFGSNSCDQCFDGGTAAAGDNRGLLTDIWDNNSDGAQILYKEEQDMPQIISLGGASWTEVKASDSVDFWQYSPEIEALYSDEEGGYVLEAGKNVKWLESTLGSAYQLTSNSADQGTPIGIIAYDIGIHQMLSGGDIAIETDTHRECVLIKSGASSPDAPVVDTTTPGTPGSTPTELPQTGPEHIFLALAALLLGFGFFYFKKKA